MAKIDSNSREWNDIIFEGRNKDYGAYRLRVNTPRRLTIAFIVLLSSIFLPVLFVFILVLLPYDHTLKIVNVHERSNMIPLQDKINPLAADTKTSKRFNRVKGRMLKEASAPIIKSDNQVPDAALDKIKFELSRDMNVDRSRMMLDTIKVDQPDVTNVTGTKELRIVLQLPEFPGGASEFMRWLTLNLHYPPQNQRAKVVGKVVVKFIVDRKGEVKEVKIVQSLDVYSDREVLRVMALMPKWKPGLQNGKPTLTQVVIPVNFKM